MIKTPDFWYKNKTLKSTLLIPVSWLYQAGHRLYQHLPVKPYQASIPVICVGNAIAGGGGKTPTVMALTKLIKKSGLYKNPYVLTRGYGRQTDESLLVSTTQHTAKNVGDEPLLLAKHVPTIVSKNRTEGAKLAEENGADILIMDDGLLNKTLHKDLNFLVVDRQIDFGNNKTIPAGPLREPLSCLLNKIDAVITIGRAFDAADHPVFEGTLVADKNPDPAQDYIGFAGLAIPDKFKNTLLDMKYNLVGWYPFADHHPYSKQEIKALIKSAREKKARIITTEKDYVRLPDEIKEKVETLPVTITFKNPNNLKDFIYNHLQSS